MYVENRNVVDGLHGEHRGESCISTGTMPAPDGENSTSVEEDTRSHNEIERCFTKERRKATDIFHMRVQFIIHIL